MKKLSLILILCGASWVLPAYGELLCTEFHADDAAISLEHPILDEISGLALSQTNPNILWGHTDSGGRPEIYAISSQGKVLYTYTISGASNVDWEDIAVGPCSPIKEQTCIYIADTGDNRNHRHDKKIFAVPEPILPTNPLPDQNRGQLEIMESWTIQYPNSISGKPALDNPDCESLMVHPKTADIYIFSKQSHGGAQTLYLMPREGTDKGRLSALGSYTFQNTKGFLGLYQAITGADFSRDGKRFAVRTYGSIFEYDLEAYPNIAETFQHPIHRFASRETQGEAIAYDIDGSIWTAGEKRFPFSAAMMHRFQCIPSELNP